MSKFEAGATHAFIWYYRREEAEAFFLAALDSKKVVKFEIQIQAAVIGVDIMFVTAHEFEGVVASHSLPPPGWAPENIPDQEALVRIDVTKERKISRYVVKKDADEWRWIDINRI